jgi:hypothetical protein
MTAVERSLSHSDHNLNPAESSTGEDTQQQLQINKTIEELTNYNKMLESSIFSSLQGSNQDS